MTNGTVLPGQRISGMTPATAANLTDLIEATQEPGNTRSLTLQQVTNLVQANGQVFVVNLLSDLRALTTRPNTVLVEGTATPTGGWFRWVPGGTVPDDGGTVIVPSSGPPGFYRRIYTGAIQMDFWPLSTVTDHTPFIMAALAYGTVVDCPPNGSLNATNLFMNVAGTVLRLNGATIHFIGSGGGNGIQLNAIDCEVLGPGKLDHSQAAIQYGVYLAYDGGVVRDIRSIGHMPNWRTPNATQPTPYAHINVGAISDATLLRRIKVIGNTMVGGAIGYDAAGMFDSEVHDNWAFNCFSVGFAYNSGGGPCVNCIFENNAAISCGYYGQSFADMFGRYVTPPTNGWNVPNQDLWLTGMIANHCGYGSYYGGHGWQVGSNKMGMDFTTNSIQRAHLTGKFTNNAAGGIEIKCAGTPAEGPLIPSFPNFARLYVEVESVLEMDYGNGAIITPGTGTPIASGAYKNNVVEINTWYTGCRNWQPGLYQYVWSAVNSNGWSWVCTGDGNGNPGYAGTNNPTPIGFVQTNASTGETSGDVIHVTSVTGITTGMMVTLNYGNGQGLPPGLYVTSVGANLITVSGVIQGPISAGAGLTLGNGASGILYTPSAIGSGSVLPLNSTVGIAVGMTAFIGGTQIPDGTIVTAVGPGNQVTLSNPITANIPADTNVTFAQEFYDGNLWWRAWQQIPPTNGGWQCSGVWVADLDGLTVRGNAYNTRYGSTCYVGVSSDNKLSNVVFENFGTHGVTNPLLMYAPNNVGTMTVDLMGCNLNADSDVIGSSAIIQVQGAMTARLRAYGGRLSAPGGSCQVVRTFNGQNLNLSLELHGGVHCYTVSAGLWLEDNNSYSVFLEDCFIDSIQPIYMAGTGSLLYGGKCTLNCQVNTPGFQWQTGSTNHPFVSGSAFRNDLRTAPNTSTAGFPGERMALASPTSTEWGYICTAGTSGGGPWTWQRLTVT